MSHERRISASASSQAWRTTFPFARGKYAANGARAQPGRIRSRGAGRSTFAVSAGYAAFFYCYPV
jgi:hypothetical protein